MVALAPQVTLTVVFRSKLVVRTELVARRSTADFDAEAAKVRPDDAALVAIAEDLRSEYRFANLQVDCEIGKG